MLGHDKNPDHMELLHKLED